MRSCYKEIDTNLKRTNSNEHKNGRYCFDWCPDATPVFDIAVAAVLSVAALHTAAEMAATSAVAPAAAAAASVLS